MGKVEWIKVSTGLFDHWKIRHILTHRSGEIMVLLWLRLLILAGQLNKRGVLALSDTVPYDAETLSKTFGKSKKLMTDTLQLFQELSMIHVSEDGFISIAGWEEHQNVDGMEKIRENNRIRKAKSRAKSASERETESKLCHANVTAMSHHVTECHTTEEERDIDIDTDKDIDTETEIEFLHHPHQTGRGRLCDVLGDSERSKLRYCQGDIGQGVVLLSDEQFEVLQERLSDEELAHYIRAVAQCVTNGHPFKRKSHYQAILDMVEADRRV